MSAPPELVPARPRIEVAHVPRSPAPAPSAASADTYDRRFLDYLRDHHRDSDLFRDRPAHAETLRTMLAGVDAGSTSMGALMDFVWTVQKEDLLATLTIQHPDRDITVRPISVRDAAEPIVMLSQEELSVVARVFASATRENAETVASEAYAADPGFKNLVDTLQARGALGRHGKGPSWIYVASALYMNGHRSAQPGDRQSAQRAARLLEGADHRELLDSGFELKFPVQRREMYELHEKNDQGLLNPFVALDNLQRMLGDVDLRLAAQGADCVIIRYLPPRAHQSLMHSLYGADAARLAGVAGEISTADIVALRDQGSRCVGLTLQRTVHLEDSAQNIHAIDFTGHDIVHGYQESATTPEARAAVATIFAAHERLPEATRERLGMDSFFNDFAFNFSKVQLAELSTSGPLIDAFSRLSVHGPSPGITEEGLRERLADAAAFRAALGDGAGLELIEKALQHAESKVRAELRRRGADV